MFQASFWSTALKTLISVSTVILLGLIFAYHALEVQVRTIRSMHTTNARLNEAELSEAARQQRAMTVSYKIKHDAKITPTDCSKENRKVISIIQAIRSHDCRSFIILACRVYIRPPPRDVLGSKYLSILAWKRVDRHCYSHISHSTQINECYYM